MNEIRNMSFKKIKETEEYKNIDKKYRKSSKNKDELIDLIYEIYFKENNNQVISNNCKRNKTEINKNELIDILKDSIKKYYENGERSNEKLKILHNYIACCIFENLKNIDYNIVKDIKIKSLPDREDRIPGEFYDKNVDISIKFKNKLIGVVSIKFIMSNYKQNENNYFENLLGECINIKLINENIEYWNIMFTFDNIPYFNKQNNITRYDNFDYKKYKKLHDNENKYLIPNNVTVNIIKINKNLIHPNYFKQKENIEKEEYLNNIYKNDFLNSSNNELDFFVNLDHFCKNIINKIKNNII